jgi:hypothetical protein
MSSNVNSLAVAVADSAWASILPKSAVRKGIYLHVTVTSGTIHLFFGDGTPSTANSIPITATGFVNLPWPIQGPVQARASTSGSGTIVKVD